MSCRSSSEALGNFLLELMCAVILIRAVATGSWPANGADLTNASTDGACSVFRRLFEGISSSPSAFRVCLSADSGGRLPNRDDMIASEQALQEYRTFRTNCSRDQRQPTVGAHLTERCERGKLWEDRAASYSVSVVRISGVFSTFQEVCRHKTHSSRRAPDFNIVAILPHWSCCRASRKRTHGR